MSTIVFLCFSDRVSAEGGPGGPGIPPLLARKMKIYSIFCVSFQLKKASLGIKIYKVY